MANITPYLVELPSTWNSANFEEKDLYDLNETDKISLVFPLTLSFSDYNTATVTTEEALTAYVNQCATGGLYGDSVNCINVIYPLEMALYHEDTSVFETVSIDNDRDMFLYMEGLYPGLRASMNYPLTVEINDGAGIQITNNLEFKTVVQDNIPLCE